MNLEVKAAIESAIGRLEQSFSIFYANLFQANLGLDQVDKRGFPVVIIIPPATWTNTRTQSGLINSTFPLRMLFLDRFTEETSDYTSEEVEPIMDNMLERGQQFISEFEDDPVITKNLKISPVTFDRIYGGFDAHLYGYGLTATVPVTVKRSCKGIITS